MNKILTNKLLSMMVFFLSVILCSLILIFITNTINDKKLEENTTYEEVKNNSNEIVNDKKEENKETIKIDNNISEPVETYFEKISTSSNTSTLKSGFVKIIDFIFYGEKINGVTFNELKDEVKLKIISFAYKIDSKIDSLFPGYKEKIVSTVKRIYTNIKERLTKLYISITTKICENRPTLCENAKEDWKVLKEDFGITWEWLKKLYGNSKEKVNEWYLEYREDV
jgi:hypothetical protein